MSLQPMAGSQQDYRNCMRSLNKSFSSMCQPQAQDPTIAHNLSYFEPPYDNYYMSSGRTDESGFDRLIDREAWTSE